MVYMDSDRFAYVDQIGTVVMTVEDLVREAQELPLPDDPPLPGDTKRREAARVKRTFEHFWRACKDDERVTLLACARRLRGTPDDREALLRVLQPPEGTPEGQGHAC
jgi:hypothetical protein